MSVWLHTYLIPLLPLFFSTMGLQPTELRSNQLNSAPPPHPGLAPSLSEAPAPAPRHPPALSGWAAPPRSARGKRRRLLPRPSLHPSLRRPLRPPGLCLPSRPRLRSPRAAQWPTPREGRLRSPPRRSRLPSDCDVELGGRCMLCTSGCVHHILASTLTASLGVLSQNQIFLATIASN